jgi:ABC transporter with metal-binding/Fe-S-binding domain ATP-binding protein
MKKKVGVLFSGGKDSCLALYKVLNKKKYRDYEVGFLLNVDVENKDSWMFHKPDLDILSKQAELLGLDLIIIRSRGRKEEELEDLKELLKRVDIDGVVVGGIKSSYQGERVRKICEELNLEFIAPLWDCKEIWEELLDKKFRVILTKISCEGLGRGWLGRVINNERLKKLRKLSEKFKFRLDFEGGEGETLVLWMPGMGKELEVRGEVESEGEYRHFFKIIKWNLKERN